MMLAAGLAITRINSVCRQNDVVKTNDLSGLSCGNRNPFSVSSAKIFHVLARRPGAAYSTRLQTTSIETAKEQMYSQSA